MNKGDRMSKEKRNIATKLETESKYLTNILDKDDVKNFKKLILIEHPMLEQLDQQALE